MRPARPYETTWEDWVLGGGARKAFDDPGLPLRVEIGPGEDEFLLDQAAGEPGINWLGIEYSHKRIERYARLAGSRGLGAKNLRIIWRPAADLIEPFLTPGVVSAYYIHFPDPWPKKHHARYRLVTPAFAVQIAASLASGGFVRLATDSTDYAAEIHAAFSTSPEMKSTYADPGWIRQPAGARMTVFEERWREMRRAIHYLEYVKR